jgi:hypothetical protein
MLVSIHLLLYGSGPEPGNFAQRPVLLASVPLKTLEITP